VTFINLEDETGMVNILCSPGCLQGTAASADGVGDGDPQSGAKRHRRVTVVAV
jgi:hypothetical protein